MNSISHISAKRKHTFLSNRPFITLLTVLLTVFMLSSAHASINSNALYRISIRPGKNFTRITLATKNQPKYSISGLTGGKLRIVLPDTDAPLRRKYRRYSDSNMGGIVVSKRGEDILLTFRVAAGSIWRDVSLDGVSAVTVDVGRQFGVSAPAEKRPGREKIWSGVEKLVRDFDPPLKSELPFHPTDRRILNNLLDINGQEAFMAAEAALYKGNLSEAEERFSQFVSHPSAIRALALYRLGEVYYNLQKYPQALASFREAEKVWPAYLNYDPGVTFCYGDSVARGGDLVTARSMLSGLIARLADKKIAPVLLVRLADMLVRQGHSQEALGIYRTVSENFRDNKATWIASLRLTDRDFLQVTPWNYHGLSDTYLRISLQSNDIDLREESLFKHALLESLHGEAPDALREIVMFQKKFPRGVYATVCRTMREVLVVQDYRQSEWSRDPSGLIRFVEEHQDYLAGCMEQLDFLPNVAKAYEKAGRPIELVKMFCYLLERQWAASGAPYMYEVVAENAELLGDDVMAEKNLREFVRKFPSHPRARLALEHLGGLMYAEGKYRESRDTLLWLLNKNERARLQESYYYLGRSLWELKQSAPAYRAMELYLTMGGGQGEKSPRFLPDAYYVAASARETSGDRRGALRLLESGLKRPELAGRDELLYKAGELNLNEGKKRFARNYFEKITKNGKDSDWQKLARHALESLDTK